MLLNQHYMGNTCLKPSSVVQKVKNRKVDIKITIFYLHFKKTFGRKDKIKIDRKSQLQKELKKNWFK